MKLLLTSSGKFITENNIDQYLPKKLIDCQIAYITTALKDVKDTNYSKNLQKRMSELGFSYTKIDITGKNENELRDTLGRYDVIMVEGGNVFYLLKMVRESGFDNVIKDLINKGVVYIGSSAGSYIAGASIVTGTWSDRGYDRYDMNYKAMNIVPFVIKAHYTSDKYNNLKTKMKKLQYPVKILTDQQALLIIDNEIKLIGEGKEIKL
ncbi:peptidase E [bacterium]|nr:peptidase E [bacterium]